MVVVARKSVTSAGKTATHSYWSISIRHSWGECAFIQIAAACCAVIFTFVLNLSRPLHLFRRGLCRRIGVDQLIFEAGVVFAVAGDECQKIHAIWSGMFFFRRDVEKAAPSVCPT